MARHWDAEGGTLGAGGPGSTVPSNKTPNKMNPTRQRGVVNRPIATSIARAQEEFKLFVTHPEDIDHNLYGRFLGILKDAGIPWKAKRLPESREDAMHTMNALVLAINAYQHYQRDVEDCFAEMEAAVSVTRTHSHAQATDVSKLHNELAKMQKEFTTQTRTLAKESSTSREMVASLKSRLVQAERDLNDSSTQVRKLRKDLEEERRRCKALTNQIANDSRPRFARPSAGSIGRPRTGSITGGGPTSRESRDRVSSSGVGAEVGRSVTPSPPPAARVSHSGPAQAVTEGHIPQAPRQRPPIPSPLPWDDERRRARAASANAIGPGEYATKHEPYAMSPSVARPLQPATPPGHTAAPATPPQTMQSVLGTQQATQIGTQPSPPAKEGSTPRLSSGEGMESDDSADVEDGAAKTKSMKKIKKFMSKLKFSAKDKGHVTVPQTDT